MIDLFGIITRTFLGLAPAPAHVQAPKPVTHHESPAPALEIVSIPLVMAPGTGSAAGSAAQLSASDTVDKVQQFYSTIKQVSAQFRQTVTNENFGSTKSSDGSVYIQKPGKMRWDYVEKRKGKVEVTKSFISNGTYLYIIEHDNKQVAKKSLDQNLMPVAVSFLYGKGDLKAEFNAELDTSNKYGGKGEIVLKLTPKKPSAQYKNLFLVVNPSDYHVSQSIIIDSSNNTNHFRFFAPDFQKPIKDTWFEFDPASVPNYRKLDLDQQGGAAPATMSPVAPVTPAPVAPKKP